MEQHKCPACNQPLWVSRGYYGNKKDWLPVVKTETYYNQDMICINPKCDNYAGPERGNPRTVVMTVSNRVN